MLERFDNAWNIYQEYTYLCITTNGYIKSNGQGVMGRGIALEAAKRYTNLPTILGTSLKINGNHVAKVNNKLIFFPVKHTWDQPADITLIQQSCIELMHMLQTNETALLPRPGCGNGKLNWKDVKPVIEKLLDNRVTIIHHKEESTVSVPTNPNIFKLIVAGSRAYHNYDHVKSVLDQLLVNKMPFVEIVSGCAPGVDTLAIQYAQEHNLPCAKFPADWDQYGKSAGPIRNGQMARYANALCAFLTPESRGTKHMITVANDNKLIVKIVPISSPYTKEESTVPKRPYATATAVIPPPAKEPPARVEINTTAAAKPAPKPSLINTHKEYLMLFTGESNVFIKETDKFVEIYRKDLPTLELLKKYSPYTTATKQILCAAWKSSPPDATDNLWKSRAAANNPTETIIMPSAIAYEICNANNTMTTAAFKDEVLTQLRICLSYDVDVAHIYCTMVDKELQTAIASLLMRGTKLILDVKETRYIINGISKDLASKTKCLFRKIKRQEGSEVYYTLQNLITAEYRKILTTQPAYRKLKTFIKEGAYTYAPFQVEDKILEELNLKQTAASQYIHSVYCQDLRTFDITRLRAKYGYTEPATNDPQHVAEQEIALKWLHLNHYAATPNPETVKQCPLCKVWSDPTPDYPACDSCGYPMTPQRIRLTSYHSYNTEDAEANSDDIETYDIQEPEVSEVDEDEVDEDEIGTI